MLIAVYTSLVINPFFFLLHHYFTLFIHKYFSENNLLKFKHFRPRLLFGLNDVKYISCQPSKRCYRVNKKVKCVLLHYDVFTTPLPLPVSTKLDSMNFPPIEACASIPVTLHLIT